MSLFGDFIQHYRGLTSSLLEHLYGGDDRDNEGEKETNQGGKGVEKDTAGMDKDTAITVMVVD